jgi:hypothetical protein
MPRIQTLIRCVACLGTRHVIHHRINPDGTRTTTRQPCATCRAEAREP